VRVLDAVEQQHQQLLVRLLLQSPLDERSQPGLIEYAVTGDFSHDSLMADFAADLAQAGTIGCLHVDAARVGRVDKCLDTRIGGSVFGIQPSNSRIVACQ